MTRPGDGPRAPESHKLQRIRRDVQEEERFRTAQIWIFAALVVFAGLAILDLVKGKYGIAAFEAGGALLLLGALSSKSGSPIRNALRWIAPAYVFLAYLVAYVTVDVRGAAVLWIFGVPLGMYHLFGLRWGSIVTAPFTVLFLIWMFYPGSATVALLPIEYRTRATATYFALLLIAALQERVRNQMKQRLREATERIKLLEGMLPICAGCKKIRDGSTWEPIDAYLTEKTEAVFSHGLCPDCEIEWENAE